MVVKIFGGYVSSCKCFAIGFRIASTLYDLLPGYLPQPAADGVHDTLDSYVAHRGQAAGYWCHFREYIVSLLKASCGDATQRENDYRLGWMPRIECDHSQLPTFNRMSRGELKGYFLFGQNPGGGGLHARPDDAGARPGRPASVPPHAAGVQAQFAHVAGGSDADRLLGDDWPGRAGLTTRSGGSSVFSS
jgi:hypothetical protein